jgi:hypothetical protein
LYYLLLLLLLFIIFTHFYCLFIIFILYLHDFGFQEVTAASLTDDPKMNRSRSASVPQNPAAGGSARQPTTPAKQLPAPVANTAGTRLFIFIYNTIFILFII